MLATARVSLMMNRAAPRWHPAQPKAPTMLLGLSLDQAKAKVPVKHLQPPLEVRPATQNLKKTAVKVVCRLALLLSLLLPAVTLLRPVVTVVSILILSPALVLLLPRQLQAQPSLLLLSGQAQVPLLLRSLPNVQVLALMPVLPLKYQALAHQLQWLWLSVTINKPGLFTKK